MKKALLLSTLLALTTGASPAAVTLSNLLAYYPFDGSDTDASGNAPAAALQGTASYSGLNGGYDGTGQSLHTNGGGHALVTTGNHFDSAVTENKMAVSFWQWNDGDSSTNGNGAGFSSTTSFTLDTTSNTRGFQAHAPWGNGTVYFDHSGGTGGQFRLSKALTNGAQELTTGQWDHLVFQKNGGTKEIWINGSLFHSGATTAALIALDGNAWIGSQTDGNDAGNLGDQILPGRIDDFAVWDEPLSQAQITSLAGGTSVAQLVGIPEPSSAGILMLFAATLGLRRRRR